MLDASGEVLPLVDKTDGAGNVTKVVRITVDGGVYEVGPFTYNKSGNINSSPTVKFYPTNCDKDAQGNETNKVSGMNDTQAQAYPDPTESVMIRITHNDDSQTNYSYKATKTSVTYDSIVKHNEKVGELTEQLQYTNYNDGNSNVAAGDITVQGATGASINMDIVVTNAEGRPVEGTISYAANDLDFRNYQDLWGHARTGNDEYKYNERMSFNYGTQSYAVVPDYNHNGTNTGGNDLDSGWIPANALRDDGDQLTHPLHIEGGTGLHANGVVFSSEPAYDLRNTQGTFTDANGRVNVPFNTSKAITAIDFKDPNDDDYGNVKGKNDTTNSTDRKSVV